MDAPPPRTPALTTIERAVLVAVVAVVVGLRFVTRSPLWLDEALSVNIAALPVDEIGAALRQDGHPPLYYLLLHWWMDLFGQGDVAVRSLSGIFSVATLPLAWIAGRRRWGSVGAWATLVVLAVMPYSLRYATEARMYSLLSLLTLGAWLLADDLRTRSDRRRWFGLAVLTGLALLTHYWTIYLGIAAVGLLGWRWWRHGARDEALRIGSALAAGVVFFLPWLPSFLEQAANTGTPWATATRPTRAVVELAGGLGGGETVAEGLLFGLGVLLLAAVALVLRETRDRELLLDLRTVPAVRSEVVVVVATIVVGLAVGAISQATFIARYAAGLVPLLAIAAGVALARMPTPWTRRLLGGGLLVLASVGVAFNVVDDRTQGEQFSATILADGSADDLVAFCPDQLGPSTLRGLPEEVDAVGVPALERPDRIDWVDYAARNRSADPEAVVGQLLERAEGRTIWLVYSTTYRTYEGVCEGVLAGLSAARPANAVAVAADQDVFEHATLLRFDP